MKIIFALFGSLLFLAGGGLFVMNLESPAITLTAPLLIAINGTIFICTATILEEISKVQKHDK